MVAPVRETVSQTLAALLTHMPRRSVLHVHSALLQMVESSPIPTPSIIPTSGLGLGISMPSTASYGHPSIANGKGKGRAFPNGSGSSREFVWQVRHAGLVGIKYLVSVRPDLFDDDSTDGLSDSASVSGGGGVDVLKGVIDAAVSGLKDRDDDVRSVAATCLIPITSQLVQRLSSEVERVLDVLWDCLGDMKDDLSSSVGFVMELLSKSLVSR